MSRSNDPSLPGHAHLLRGADVLGDELAVPFIRQLLAHRSPPDPGEITTLSHHLAWDRETLHVTPFEGDVITLKAGDIDGLQLSRVIHRPTRTAWQRFLGRHAREALFLHAVLRNRRGLDLRLQAVLDTPRVSAGLPLMRGRTGANVDLDSLRRVLRVALFLGTPIARWHLAPRVPREEAMHANRPREVVVLAHGGGDVIDLPTAVDTVAPGGLIRLGEGTFRLATPLRLQDDVRIEGAGQDDTRIVGRGVGPSLIVSSIGQVSFSDLTLAHQHREPGVALRVDRGQVLVLRCRLTGGRGRQHRGSGGVVCGHGHLTMRDSICERNQGHGLTLTGHADALLSHSTYQRNGGHGVALEGEARARVQYDTCTHNRGHGLHVLDQANVQVLESLFQANMGTGLAIESQSAPDIMNSVFSDNRSDGLLVRQDAAPRVVGNICRRNTRAGLAFGMFARGFAKDNVCVNNMTDGICVRWRAAPTLEHNVCRYNSRDGLRFDDQSGGDAHGHRVHFNGSAGVWIAPRAKPHLQANEGKGNPRGLEYREPP